MSHRHPKKYRVQLLSLMLAVALTAAAFSAPGYSRSDVGKRNSASLETHEIHEAHTALLRANGKIAYSSGSIHVMNGDGSNQTKLTNASLSLHADPAWSPDGSKIAFSGNRDAAFDTEIYVINADGTNQINVTNDRGLDWSPAWSPDGTRIAFTRMRLTQFGFTDPAIFVMNADGSNQTMVTNDKNYPHGCTEPSWSPDGTKIAFGTRTRLVSGGILVPDEIFVMNSDGSNLTNLTNSVPLEGSPTWSPDGTRIAFTRQPLFEPIDDTDSGSLHELEIYVMNADGSNPTRLTNNAAADFDPAWSPDGTKLAFASSRDGNADDSPEIYVMNADGSNATRLTNNPNVFSFGPAWQALPASANPIDSPAFFVRHHYLDFLGREPDPDGLDFWTREITSCGDDAECVEIKRINVSAAFFLSIEFQETGFLVYKTYGAAFGVTRMGFAVPLTLSEFLPDLRRVGQGVVVGATGWQVQLESNQVAYFNEFVTRSDFVASYPTTMTSAEYVDALNANSGGVLSTSERDQFVADLISGTKTRAEVLGAVAEDADFTGTQFNRAFVLLQYFGYLRRNPNDAPDTGFGGYNFWLSKLDQFNGNFIEAEMVKAFLVSQEYRRRFGNP